jgi:nicotinamide riboside transporter PnuC
MTGRPQLIPACAAACLLFVALGHQPYGYYTFLRWAVSAAAVSIVILARRGLGPAWLFVVFVGVACLFNPLTPVYLARSTWRPIDIVIALLFLASAAVDLVMVASRPAD